MEKEMWSVWTLL